VLDLSNSTASRALVADAVRSQVIEATLSARSLSELEDWMRRGEVAVALYVPADFDQRLTDPTRPGAQLWIDGSDPQILAAARQLAELPHPNAVASRQPVLKIRPFYNPERSTARFIVPGLLGVVLTMTMIMFTAIAIVRERERGNLEFLITTPVTPIELMLGKLAPYVAIGLLQVTMILWVGRVVFDVPVRGSVVELYLAAVVFIAASLSLGLLISTRAQSQFQAMQLAFFIFLPSILLSGFMFPFAGMPKLVQWIAELLPLTHFLRIVRGLLLRGASLSELADQLAWLAGFFVIATGVAALRFKKNLD